jgi:hypothetical protein
LNFASLCLTGLALLVGFSFTGAPRRRRLLGHFAASQSLATLPSGLTFDGFTDLVAGFLPNNSSGLHYSATVNTQDVTIKSTQQTLVVANFTAAAPGNYAISFIPPGDFQELSDGNFNPLSFTSNNNTATIATAPEPVVYSLLLLGLGLLMAFGRFLRAALASNRSSTSTPTTVSPAHPIVSVQRATTSWGGRGAVRFVAYDRSDGSSGWAD